MSSQNTSSSNATNPCNPTAQTAFYMLFNQMCLIPAAIVVIIFLFMTKRAKLKKGCLDGRPGIQVPVDFLGEEKNRFSYVAGYGAMAIAVANMFLSSKGSDMVFKVEGHPFIKVFQSIVTVICIGTIYLPFFMCLSTDAKLLGAVFGALYTLMRLAGLTVLTLFCPIYIYSTFIYWPIFFDLPAQLFHLVLLIRFIIIFVKEARNKCCKKKFVCRDLLGEECDFTVGRHYVDHVKTLLQGVPKMENRKWYVKGRNFVYTPLPHFKYSVAILSTVVVAGVIIYQLLIAAGGIFVGLIVAYRSAIVNDRWTYILMYGFETYELILKFVDISIVSFVVSLVVSALFMFFQMYRMLVSHRNHVIKLIKGDRRFLPSNVSAPHIMVGMSLRFAGYQVAHFLWGFLILAGFLLVFVLTISAAILFLPMIFGNQLQSMIGRIGFTLLPTVAMALFIFIVQQILARFVFKDRSIDSKVVNIHNRRLFLLVSFFFFFFNILVGLISCFLRILKGIILGVLFIGRIDRPLIMKGFTNLDSAYCAYIGFLHLQVAHKHPVVKVFLHLLWSGMRRKQQQRLRSSVDILLVDLFKADLEDTPFPYNYRMRPAEAYVDVERVKSNCFKSLRQLELCLDVSGANKNSAINGWAELKESNPSRPRVSASALNKWFIAVTVIRNPTLIYNRKGFLRHILLGIPNSPSLNSRDGLQENDGNQSDEKHLSKNSKDNGEHGTELRTPTPDNLDGIISIRDNKINGNVEYTEHHF